MACEGSLSCRGGLVAGLDCVFGKSGEDFNGMNWERCFISSNGPRELTLKLSSALAASILLGDFSACKIPGIVNPSLSDVLGYFWRIVSTIADIVDSSRESFSLVMSERMYFQELSCFFYQLHQLGGYAVAPLHLWAYPRLTATAVVVHRSSCGPLQSQEAPFELEAVVQRRTPILARQGLLRQTHELLVT